jgi:hypothetical protein
MSDSPDAKSSKRSISFPDPLLSFAMAKAKADHGDNLSRYVQSLIERDQAGDAEVLINLARRFAPVLVAELTQELQSLQSARAAQRALLSRGTVRQDVIVFRFLEALTNALKREFDPEAPFELYSSRDQFEEVIRQSPAIFRALQAVAETGAAYGPSATSSAVDPLLSAEQQRRAREEGTASSDPNPRGNAAKRRLKGK